EGYDWERMGALAGCPARPVMRIERVAEEALGGGFDEFRERVRAEVSSAPARGFAGLKTIAAYRTGLDVGAADVDAAREAFRASGPRLGAKPLLELAPASKLLYASDAARTPELYLLAARWWRTALAEVLGAELPAADAERVGSMILRENAHAVYPLDG